MGTGEMEDFNGRGRDNLYYMINKDNKFGNHFRV